MSILFFSLIVATVVIAGAIFANQARARQQWIFELKPNCLLTRYPLLFVTGPRSLFYFSHYWNQYPVVLAEHGYEVFTLHLPWSKPLLRQERMKDFFNIQSKLGRKFHLIIDPATLGDLESIYHAHQPPSCLLSLTEIGNGRVPQRKKTNLSLSFRPIDLPHRSPRLTLKLLNKGHQLLTRNYQSFSLESLGADSTIGLQNSWKILERAQELAESDLFEN